MYVHIQIYKLCNMYIGDPNNKIDNMINRIPQLEKIDEQTHISVTVKCTVCVACMRHFSRQIF